MFLRRAMFLFSTIYLQSCVFEGGDVVDVKILNLSSNRVYVNSLSGECDSCEIKRDIKAFCTNGKSFDTINAKDSLSSDFKFNSYVLIYSINADSLDSYCKKDATNDLYKKSWVKVLTPSINIKNRTGKVVIQ